MMERSNEVFAASVAEDLCGLIANAGKYFSNLTKRNSFVIENDGGFFPFKIDPATKNIFIDPVKVLEQPETTAAMDLWQVKCYVRLFFVFKTD